MIEAYVPPVLGAVWAAGAWSKLMRSDESVRAIQAALIETGLGPIIDVRWLLLGVIAVEFSLGFGLIFGVAPRLLVVVSGAVLIPLTIWVGFLAAQNPEAPCGCGIKLGWWESGSIARGALQRNLVLLAVHGGLLGCLLGLQRREDDTCINSAVSTNGECT